MTTSSGLRRYTTPSIGVSIAGADLTGCDVYLTLLQGGVTLTLRLDTSEDWQAGTEQASGTVTLTQDQSAMFEEGKDVEVQANAISQDGHRWASGIATVRFGRNLMSVRRDHE